MAVAIVLISAEPGKDRKVASQLKKLEGAEKPFLVSGLYDVNNNAGRWILPTFRTSSLGFPKLPQEALGGPQRHGFHTADNPVESPAVPDPSLEECAYSGDLGHPVRRHAGPQFRRKPAGVGAK